MVRRWRPRRVLIAKTSISMLTYTAFPLLAGPDQGFHIETLLDGELVLDTLPGGEQRTFLVFDCLAVRGQSLLQKTLETRVGYFVQGVYKPYRSMLNGYSEEKGDQPFAVLPYETNVRGRIDQTPAWQRRMSSRVEHRPMSPVWTRIS